MKLEARLRAFAPTSDVPIQAHPGVRVTLQMGREEQAIDLHRRIALS